MIAGAVRVTVVTSSRVHRRYGKFLESGEVARFDGEYCESLKHLETFVETASGNGWSKSAAQIESTFPNWRLQRNVNIARRIRHNGEPVRFLNSDQFSRVLG